MHENNLFVSANGKPTVHTQSKSPTQSQTKAESDAQLKDRLQRKQAASPSRQQKAVVKDTTNYNPLEMSDEDFVKLNKLQI